MPSLLLQSTPKAPVLVERHLEMRATVHTSREQTMYRLRAVLYGCGAYVLEDRDSARSHLALLFEVPRSAVFDLYSGLLGVELDLCRDSHLRLSGLCTLRRHNPARSGNVTVLLELTFRDAIKTDDLWSAVGFA